MGLNASPTIAILASGRGSNFEAIADAIEAKLLDARIAVVISDRPESLVLEKAKARGLETLVEKNQKKMKSTLQELNLDYLVLAGFMRILSAEFISAFSDPRGFARIVNIHPSLLPEFPGLESYKKAFEQKLLGKLSRTGITVHFVDAGVDTGLICAQREFSISDCHSVEDVERRGLAVEHELYPQTLQWVLQNQFEIIKKGEKLHVQPHRSHS
ncbi:MAG TPA: phosphoribosylglycinamide formyltransferase [Pseudobdellovibrionaceae bacterium]